MSRSGGRRDIRSLERCLRDLTEGASSMDRDAQPGLESSLLEMLVSGGPELPAAGHTDALKTAYVERGTSLREQAIVAGGATARPARLHRVRTQHALARAAAAATVIVALLGGLGFGSAYAMPGNPLYSVKRAAESAYLSLVPGDQNKADAYASYTSRRLNELEHVEERGMSRWYYSLASDAEGGIGNTYGHGKRLRAEAAKKVTAKAQALTRRLEELLGVALGKMTPAEKAGLERGLERIRVQLRMRKGASTEPSQQDGQPNGPQNTAPGGPQAQPGQQQQQQQNLQTEPGSPDQPGGPVEPSQGPGDQGQQSPKQGTENESSGKQGSTTPNASSPQARPDVGTRS